MRIVIKVAIWVVMTLLVLTVAALIKNIYPLPSEYTGSTSHPTGSGAIEVTLRDFLNHPDGFHLAMAPSFFGFYSYLGALIAMEEEMVGILPTHRNSNNNTKLLSAADTTTTPQMKSVVGSSAGAMVAVLIAAGVSPRLAANFITSLTLQDFADPPGILAVFRGIKFDLLMKAFLKKHTNHDVALLEDAILPVAVTTFDLTTWKEKVFSDGCMAKIKQRVLVQRFLGCFNPYSRNILS